MRIAVTIVLLTVLIAGCGGATELSGAAAPTTTSADPPSTATDTAKVADSTGPAPAPTVPPETTPPTAPDPLAAMMIEPDTLTPGQVAELTYTGDPMRGEPMRGIAFSFERRDDESWEPEAILIATPTNDETAAPSWQPLDSEVGIPALGVVGPGPDFIVIPEIATEGEHRICSAMTRQPLCVEVFVNQQ